MPVPHLNIRIVQRSKGSSAVAGAAYQAGEKLFSEYDQKNKDHRRKQKEVVYTEIMLPTNAPPEYADRATLWNSAEEVEKQWNSQLARRFVVALPREVPMEMYPQMMQEYCREHFVSKGIYMLNQASEDRTILAQRLNISPHQLSYVTNSGEGEGLLFYGNVILPFVDRFPKDIELYRIMTTKLSEVSKEKEG